MLCDIKNVFNFESPSKFEGFFFAQNLKVRKYSLKSGVGFNTIY